MKIKVKLINKNCKFEVIKKGEWIDLKSSDTISLNAPEIMTDEHSKNLVIFNPVLIPLGIAMELPKYFEANILPRSSTFKNYGIQLVNSMGIIDSSYNGDDDEWLFAAIPYRSKVIVEGDRIAQFRIRPSQFAPWWVKFRWLFTNKIKFKFVETLNNTSRGGFGSTGIK